MFLQGLFVSPSPAFIWHIYEVIIIIIITITIIVREDVVEGQLNSNYYVPYSLNQFDSSVNKKYVYMYFRHLFRPILVERRGMSDITEEGLETFPLL